MKTQFFSALLAIGLAKVAVASETPPRIGVMGQCFTLGGHPEVVVRVFGDLNHPEGIVSVQFRDNLPLFATGFYGPNVMRENNIRGSYDVDGRKGRLTLSAPLSHSWVSSIMLLNVIDPSTNTLAFEGRVVCYDGEAAAEPGQAKVVSGTYTIVDRYAPWSGVAEDVFTNSLVEQAKTYAQQLALTNCEEIFPASADVQAVNPLRTNVAWGRNFVVTVKAEGEFYCFKRS